MRDMEQHIVRRLKESSASGRLPELGVEDVAKEYQEASASAQSEYRCVLAGWIVGDDARRKLDAADIVAIGKIDELCPLLLKEIVTLPQTSDELEAFVSAAIQAFRACGFVPAADFIYAMATSMGPNPPHDIMPFVAMGSLWRLDWERARNLLPEYIRIAVKYYRADTQSAYLVALLQTVMNADEASKIMITASVLDTNEQYESAEFILSGFGGGGFLSEEAKRQFGGRPGNLLVPPNSRSCK